MKNMSKIQLNNTKVLVVEDSPVQAKKLKHFLEYNGFLVVQSSNGEEALDALEKDLPHIVVSDIIMPVMDGYELCERIKKDDRLKDIPVILLTSLKDPMDIIKGLQAGADNFITKPYDEQYLLTRIQHLLINRNIRMYGGTDMEMEIVFREQKFLINSEKKQILDLLLSVYEAAIFQNDELIKTQNMLEKANEELQQANKELDSFARTVSHDLKNPIAKIMGFVEILLEDFTEGMDPNAIQYLQIIERSTDSMLQLVEDLLRMSRSSTIELKITDVDLTKIAREIIEGFRESEPDRDIEVIISEGLQCRGDEGLIRAAMLNMLGNSWKYTGKTEKPVILFGKMDEHEEQPFFISDNGAGFDMAKSHKLFRPFERMHPSTQFQGTGVGLATVKRIIERHGGRIWVEAAVDEGATFFWTIKSEA